MKMNNPIQTMMEQTMNNSMPKMNIETLRNFLPKINQNEMNQLKQIAKSMGMSDEQISQGLNYLNNLK